MRTDTELTRHFDEYLHRSMSTPADGNARLIQQAHFGVGHHIVRYFFERRSETIVDQLVSNHDASLRLIGHIAFDRFRSRPDLIRPEHILNWQRLALRAKYPITT